MPARPGTRPPSAGVGRRKGVPNKITKTMREAIAQLVDQNMPRMQHWLDAIAERNPEKAADLLVRLLEYTTPKLVRAELRPIDTAPPPTTFRISFEDGGPGCPISEHGAGDANFVADC